MPTARRFDVVDLISALLQNEQAGLFHFLFNADPYINAASAELKRPLEQLYAATLRREGELVQLLAGLGSTPAPAPVQPEHQYLAYLALDYLVPKLVEAKQKSIVAYDRTLTLLGPRQSGIAELLSRHLAEHRAELQVLRGFASRISPETAPGSQQPSRAFDPKQN